MRYIKHLRDHENGADLRTCLSPLVNMMNMNTARQISTNTELNESSVDKWIQIEHLHVWNADVWLSHTSGWSGPMIISQRCS